MKKVLILIMFLLIIIAIKGEIIGEIGRWEYGPTEAIAVKDSVAYISSGSYLWVLDISDESNPVLIDEKKLENYINYIRVIGNYLYISKQDSILEIYDIHKVDSIYKVNEIIQVNGWAWADIYELNDTLYLGSFNGNVWQYYINDTINLIYERSLGEEITYKRYNNIGIGVKNNYGISIYDLSQTGDVYIRNASISSTEARGLALREPYCYYGKGIEGVGIVEIVNVDSMIEHSDYVTGGECYDVEIIEDTILIASRGIKGIGIYDIENDTTITLIGEVDTEGYAYEIEVKGDRVYVGARSGGLQIIDISDKSNPIQIGEYNSYGEFRGLSILGDRLYVASGEGGLSIYDISDRDSIVLVNQIYTRWKAEDVSVDSNYAYVAEGDSGLTIVDISNESNLSIVSNTDLNYYCHGRQVGVYGDMCVVGGDRGSSINQGIEIIDISDRNNPIGIDSIMVKKDNIYFILENNLLHCIGEGLNYTRVYELWDLGDMYNKVLRDSIRNELFDWYYLTLGISDSLLFLSPVVKDSIYCYDKTNVDSITYISGIEISSGAWHIRAYSNYVLSYNLDWNIYVYDYNDLLNPVEVQVCTLGRYGEDIERTGNYIYIGQGGGSVGNLGRGKYGLRIYGMDVNGPSGITIISPQSGDSVIVGDVEVIWSKSISDIGIDRYELNVDSIKYTTTDTSYILTITSGGIKSIYVKAIDRIGNEVYSDTVELIVSGIEDRREESIVEIEKDIRYIVFKNKSDKIVEYRVIDIIGREVDKITINPREEKVYKRKSGIYYIINGANKIEEKIVIIR